MGGVRSRAEELGGLLGPYFLVDVDLDCVCAVGTALLPARSPSTTASPRSSSTCGGPSRGLGAAAGDVVVDGRAADNVNRGRAAEAAGVLAGGLDAAAAALDGREEDGRMQNGRIKGDGAVVSAPEEEGRAAGDPFPFISFCRRDVGRDDRELESRLRRGGDLGEARGREESLEGRRTQAPLHREADPAEKTSAPRDCPDAAAPGAVAKLAPRPHRADTDAAGSTQSSGAPAAAGSLTEPTVLKTVEIDCFLKAMVLLGWLSLGDYFYVARDAPRRAMSGVYLEQRYQAFVLLWEKFLRDYLGFRRGSAESRERAGDRSTSASTHPSATIPSAPHDGDSMGATALPSVTTPSAPHRGDAIRTFASAHPNFRECYERHYSECAETVAKASDQWETTREAWRPLVEQVFLKQRCFLGGAEQLSDGLSTSCASGWDVRDGALDGVLGSSSQEALRDGATNQATRGDSSGPQSQSYSATAQQPDYTPGDATQSRDAAQLFGSPVWQPFVYDGACATHLRSLGFQNVVHDAGEEAPTPCLDSCGPAGPADKEGPATPQGRPDFFALARDASFLEERGIKWIWDNPPYGSLQTKRRVLKALVGTGKPFCVLMPISVLQGPLLREVLTASSGGSHQLSSSTLCGRGRSQTQGSKAAGPEFPKGHGGNAVSSLSRLPPDVQVIIPTKVPCRAHNHGKPTGCKGLIWLCYRMALDQDVYFLA